jgi:predicted GNAT family N-acyltransferase
MTFTGHIYRGEELLITCELIYVFADPKTQTSRPVPKAFRAIVEGYEAGEPMVELRTGGWAELGSAAQRIRHEVFVQEQSIPAELEWDESDRDALHAVAFNRLGQAVATGRLLQERPGVGRIGRMAVHRMLRGSGVGRQVLQTLMAAAARRGDHEAVLHAQRSAQAFYSGMGFQQRGEAFDEAGIPHIEMARALPAA